jgi:hypothetical protein
VPRRISLPSSDELFGDRAPYAGGGADKEPAPRKRARRATTAPPVPAAAAPRAPAGKPRRPRPATQPVAAGTRRRMVTPRIERVESKLRDLPIDTLLELRDGLEALLIGGTVTEADVERLLAVAGA